MKKPNFRMARLTGLFAALATSAALNAQIIETMGTTAAGTGTQTIAAREAADQFDQVSLTYSGTADMRTTVPSTGYAGASGGYNVLIQAQETFQVSAINAIECSEADSLIFGVYKTINASTGIDYLVVEYSIDNGLTWTNMPYAALPTGTGTSRWHRRGVAVPVAAHVPNLWVRFRSTLVGTSSANPQFRIDDLNFTCGSDISCGTPSAEIDLIGNSVFCEGTSVSTIKFTTDLVDATYQWYNQDGIISGSEADSIVVGASGTYYVTASDENGCDVTSSSVYIKTYPSPQYCPVEASACSRDTVEICVNVQATGLIFSEYVEGTSFNKYLEIYNGTCEEVNLADYQVRLYQNGGSAIGASATLAGTLAAGGVYVIAHPDANIWTGTPNQTSNAIQFNGDDAVVLYNVTDDFAVDIFGSVGFDPGSAWRDNDTLSATYGWRTVDKTLRRKACVYSGVFVNPSLPGVGGFPTLFTEWDTLAVDDVTGLGSHEIGASSYSFTSSGSAVVLGNVDNCVTIVGGAGSSTITIDGDFCIFNDCADINNTFEVVCNEGRSLTTDAAEEAAVATAVFPNPTVGNVTVALQNAAAGKVTIELVNMYGNTVSVLHNQYMEGGAYNLSFDISNLASGAYILRINTAAGQETLRIIRSAK